MRSRCSHFSRCRRRRDCRPNLRSNPTCDDQSLAYVVTASCGQRRRPAVDGDLPRRPSLRLQHRRWSLSALDGRSRGTADTGTRENLDPPFFSPMDNRLRIAFGGQLKRVALRGGAPSVIADSLTDPLGASWGPDGTILFRPAARHLSRFGQRRYSRAHRSSPRRGATLRSRAVAGRQLGALQRCDERELGRGTDRRAVAIDGQADAASSRAATMRITSSSGHLVYALRDGASRVAFDAATLTTSGGPVSLVQDVARSLGLPRCRATTISQTMERSSTLILEARRDGRSSGSIVTATSSHSGSRNASVRSPRFARRDKSGLRRDAGT